ncbi:polysaccharide lyase family 1 protein [Paenactinomyces guangxiensis]|uniref:pectate lyase family protein n=1 Tax=Paenactinomyces guangxiensis TaxID=1490290 RepID=UPI001C68E44B
MSTVLATSLLAVSFTSVHAGGKDPGREVLGPKDGWAAARTENLTGTTGGAAADADHVFTVTNRRELIEALKGDKLTTQENDTPKIIYVRGTIKMNVDEHNQELTAEDYSKGTGYDFEKYLAEYAPEKWGMDEEVYGPLESARAAAQKKQEEQIMVKVGSNTTIIGKGDDAKIIGGGLILDHVQNVIIRNIEFEAPIDYFPQWDPTDGSEGNWNSEYDNISILNGTHHVWIDHNTFSDGAHPDSASGEYFGRPYQQHDGLLDVKNGANYVTVSYNVFQDHDKVTIVGSSDHNGHIDRGKLKVTFHHNHYKNLSQRLPRVRFGEVHVYNNYYEFSKESEYRFDYALGVGVESKIYAENNYFDFDYNVDPSKILKNWKGTSIYEDGSMISGRSKHHRVDLVAAYNRATTDPAQRFNENVGWVPRLYNRIDPTQSVPALVQAQAGAGKLK